MNTTSKIHVLHVIDKLSMDGVNPSSCAFLLRDWIENLDRSTFYITVCTLTKNDPAKEIIEKVNTRVHFLEHGKISLKNINSIMRLIDTESADILHLHGYSASNFGRIAARRKKINNIVHEHAVLKILPYQYLADFLLQKTTDAAIAVSENVKKFMIHGRNIPSSKIRVIHNGTNLKTFRRINDDSIRRKKKDLSIGENQSVIGTVSRLREEKGVEYLIRSIPLILKKIPDLVLLVIGDGPLKNKLKNLVNELNICKNVRFLGFRNDIPELLSILQVNIIPSLSEGFPLSLVEAMAAKVPIVATSVGGINEVTDDGEFALLVPPRNIIQLSSKVIHLLQNKQCGEKLASKAYMEARNYSIEKNVCDIRKIYLESITKR